MLAKLKGSSGSSGSSGSVELINGREGREAPSTLLASNPISRHFKAGSIIGTSGPELAWQMFEATRISDGKVSWELNNRFRFLRLQSRSFREIERSDIGMGWVSVERLRLSSKMAFE